MAIGAGVLLGCPFWNGPIGSWFFPTKTWRLYKDHDGSEHWFNSLIVMNDKMQLREKSNSVRLFLLDVPTHPKRTKPKIQGAIHWLSFLDCPVKLKLERFTRFCQARPSQPQRKSTLLRRGQRNIGSGSLEFFLFQGDLYTTPGYTISEVQDVAKKWRVIHVQSLIRWWMLMGQQWHQ